MANPGLGNPPDRPARDDAPSSERRRHTRTGLAVPAELSRPDGPSVPGRATGVSFGGTLFVPDRSESLPAAGATVTVALGPEDTDGPIVFACRVARVSAEGVGLRFLATDPAGFERFADLIVLGAEGSGSLVEEMRVSPGFEVATDEGLRRALD